jgi:hypothetical protein
VVTSSRTPAADTCTSTPSAGGPRHTPPPVSVAAIIPAKDEEERIAQTVEAVRCLPCVDLVVVVDDGSCDATARAAADAGAEVISHARNRGKAAAMQTGALRVATRDREEGTPPRALLFVDADLGSTAVGTAPLLEPVLGGTADVSIAILPRQVTAGGGHGFVVGLATRGITDATGWTPTQPLSGMRCLTRDAFHAALPLASRWGVETAMTIDLLTAGYRVTEVACDLQHRVSGAGWAGQLHRAAQFRDVALALAVRRGRRSLPLRVLRHSERIGP